MEYRLNKSCGDTVAIPALVLRRLSALTPAQLAIILAILRDGEVREAELLREFAANKAVAPELSGPQNLDKILNYWAGAGLLEVVQQAGAPAAAAPVAPRAPKPPRLSAREIAAAAATDEQVSILITESQNLFGGLLNEGDGNLLASLYLQDKLPVDMILTGIAHFVARGKRNVKYIARALLSWRESGIRTGADAERYLAVLAQRDIFTQDAAKLLGIPADGLTAGECTMVARWYEEYGYDSQMISAAVQRAGDKNNVRYISAMLKKWHAKGYRTPREIEDLGPANVQAKSREVTPENDFMLRRIGKVPQFRKGEDR